MVKFLICIWMSEMKSLLIQRASLIAQFGKNPPAMQETPVWFLGWEDPLEKGKATLSSILAWRIPWSPRGRKELDTTEWLSFSLYPKEDLGKTFCLMTSKTGKGTPSQSSPRDTCNAIFPWWRNGKTGHSKSMNSLLMVSCLPLRRVAWQHLTNIMTPAIPLKVMLPGTRLCTLQRGCYVPCWIPLRQRMHEDCSGSGGPLLRAADSILLHLFLLNLASASLCIIHAGKKSHLWKLLFFPTALYICFCLPLQVGGGNAVSGAEPSPVTLGCPPAAFVQQYLWEPLEAGDPGSFVTAQTFPDQGGTQLSYSSFRS